MSTLYVDTINEKTSGNGIIIPGHVLKIQSTNFNGHQTIASSSFTEIASLATSITPVSTSSKIYIMIHLVVGDGDDDNYNQFLVKRDIGGSVTNVGVGSSVGSASLVSWQNNGPYTHAIYETHVSSWAYLDSPATTSQVTYKLFARARQSSTRTLYINRPNDTGDGNRGASSSTLTLMEIGG